MLPLLKKKSNADAAPAVPPWHPNFRNYQKLPDVKVVRTAFFVNGIATLLVVSLGAYLGFREWNLHVINQQIAHVQAQINREKKSSEQAIALFKKFQTSETKVLEVSDFVTSKPIVSSLLVRLAQTLPKNIALDNFDLRDTGISVRLSVWGSDPAAASGHATAYLEQLRADKELAPFTDVAFTSTPTRNPTTGQMAVEFLMRKAPVGGKKS